MISITSNRARKTRRKSIEHCAHWGITSWRKKFWRNLTASRRHLIFNNGRHCVFFIAEHWWNAHAQFTVSKHLQLKVIIQQTCSTRAVISNIYRQSKSDCTWHHHASRNVCKGTCTWRIWTHTTQHFVFHWRHGHWHCCTGCNGHWSQLPAINSHRRLKGD